MEDVIARGDHIPFAVHHRRVTNRLFDHFKLPTSQTNAALVVARVDARRLRLVQEPVDSALREVSSELSYADNSVVVVHRWHEMGRGTHSRGR